MTADPFFAASEHAFGEYSIIRVIGKVLGGVLDALENKLGTRRDGTVVGLPSGG